MKRLLYITLTIAILSIAAVSCDSDEPFEYGDFRFDMVTFAGYDAERAVFSLIQRDDSEINLLTTSRCSLDAKDGQRMLLNYIPAGDVTNGVQPIQAKGYTEAVTDSLRFTSRPDSVVMDSVRLKSMWRTGNYLNLSTEVKFTEGKRQLYLVMDKATWHTDTVHAFLAHNMMGEQAYFWRKCYASFYIGAVWKLQSCKVLRVHINDVTYPKVKYYDFAK
ncbi:MAG: hypothetical protein ACI4UN_09565 [Muribaculaceae bacterium]